MTALKIKDAFIYLMVAVGVGAVGGALGGLMQGGDYLPLSIGAGAGIGLVTVILYIWKVGVR